MCWTKFCHSIQRMSFTQGFHCPCSHTSRTLRPRGVAIGLSLESHNTKPLASSWFSYPLPKCDFPEMLCEVANPSVLSIRSSKCQATVRATTCSGNGQKGLGCGNPKSWSRRLLCVFQTVRTHQLPPVLSGSLTELVFSTRWRIKRQENSRMHRERRNHHRQTQPGEKGFYRR